MRSEGNEGRRTLPRPGDPARHGLLVFGLGPGCPTARSPPTGRRLTAFLTTRHNAAMSGTIMIEGLEFSGACGVTDDERARPQPIAIDAELAYDPAAFEDAARSGLLSQGLDYAAVCTLIRAIGTAQPYVLLETLADRLARELFNKFPVAHLSLWVRKLSPPLGDIHGSVGVKLARHRDDLGAPLAPAPFLREISARLPQGRALDLAAGRGRNALFLARQGWTVEALDRDEQALSELRRAADAEGLRHLTTRTIDLEPAGPPPPDLGAAQYDVITVFFYLYRPLFPMLIRALRPGGVLVYETFLVDNHLRYGHPRRREFCLEPNELLRLTAPLSVLHYDEGMRIERGSLGAQPSQIVTARLLARKS